MSRFEYFVDKPRHWWPWTETAYHRMGDDCDGAAVLWHWCFNKLGISNKVCTLYGKENHAVCVGLSPDKVLIGSNNTLIKIRFDPHSHWLDQTLWFFQPLYYKIKIIMKYNKAK